MVPSIPAAPSGHRAQAPTAPPNVADPRASLLLPWGRWSWSPHSPVQWHTAPPCHDFSSPKLFWQLSSRLQPAQPSAAGGSERRQGHHWGPRACCGQATARLSAVSHTHHVQPQHGSRESRGMERGGVGQAGGGRLAGVAMGTGVLQTPAPPGSCNPGAEGWQQGGSGGLEQGNPQQTVRTAGPSCSPQQFWKSNWKPLTTLRGHSCTGGGDARGPQRNRERVPEGWGAAPGCRRPWVCERALHPRGNATNRAACRVLRSIQLCSAQKMVQSGVSEVADPRARLGAAALPGSFLRGGSHAPSAAQSRVAEQAEPGSSPKHLHSWRLKSPKPPPWSPPARVTVGSVPQAAVGHMKGRFPVRGATPDPVWLQGARSSSPVDISNVHAAVKLGKSDGQDDAGQQEDGAPAQAEPEGVLGVGGEPSGPRQRLRKPLSLPGPPRDHPPTPSRILAFALSHSNPPGRC